MRHKGTAELRTQRLLLRRFTPEDAAAVYENWAGDSRVTRFLSWPTHRNIGETKTVLALWEASYLRDDFYIWGIVFEGRLSGSIGVTAIDEKNHSCEVGYCLAFDCWNRGIMSEALNCVLRYLLEEVGFRRVEARHHVDNPASGRVMKKCGMKVGIGK